jgi:molybdopterin biosynthesis enzyme
LRREIEPTLYWFSDVVVAASGNELETGNVPSTGGTAIYAVIKHATQQLAAGSNAIVLTDGHLEHVPAATSATLRRARVALHVGVVGGGPLHTSAAWLASSTPLPSPSF